MSDPSSINGMLQSVKVALCFSQWTTEWLLTGVHEWIYKGIFSTIGLRVCRITNKDIY